MTDLLALARTYAHAKKELAAATEAMGKAQAQLNKVSHELNDAEVTLANALGEHRAVTLNGITYTWRYGRVGASRIVAAAQDEDTP